MDKFRRLVFIVCAIATLSLFGITFYSIFFSKNITTMIWSLFGISVLFIVLGFTDNEGHL